MNRHDRRATASADRKVEAYRRPKDLEWAERLSFHPGDGQVVADGRTVKLILIINTDEGLPELIARVQEAASGPKKCMVTTFGGGTGILDGGVDIWEKGLKLSKALKEPEA